MNKFSFDIIRTIEDAREINKIMVISRFVVLAAAFFFIYLTWALNMIRFDPFIALLYVLPTIAIMNGAWFWHCQSRKLQKFYFLPQVLIDTGLVLLAVYFSGAFYSDFIFLPLIVLILAALVSWRLSIAAFALSLGFYLFLFFEQIWGLPFQEIIQSFGGLSGMKFIRILIFAFMGVLISFTISYFINEIRRRNKEVEMIKKETYAGIVRGLCDSLTAIRWILEEFDKENFFSRNKDFKENIQILRQFREKISSSVKESLATTDNDFAPIIKDNEN